MIQISPWHGHLPPNVNRGWTHFEIDVWPTEEETGKGGTSPVAKTR